MLDVTGVAQLEARQKAKALLDERMRIDGERYEAVKTLVARSRAIDMAAQEKCTQIWKAARAEQAPINAEMEAVEAPFEAHCSALGAAIDGLGLAWQWHDDYTALSCCAVSGLPLIAGDAVWSNDDYGEALLCLLMPADADDDDEVETAA